MAGAMNVPASLRRSRPFYHLAATELWERFSLHGVKALLTLYLVQHVLVGDPARIWGLAGLRRGLETVGGPLSDLGFASELYGLYAGLTYLVLPVGGMLGDRVIGRRGAVVAGALVIVAGHLCLSVERLLLPGLALLILGTGLLKVNLAAQVGDLFPPRDPRRGNGFAVYLAFLNVGVMLGPLVCGWLAQAIGWPFGFGAAAIGMGAGLAIYLAMPAVAAVRPVAASATDADRAGSPAAAFLAILVVVLGFCAYEQMSNIFLVWASAHVALHIGGFAVPPSWFAAADGLFTILMVAVTLALPGMARIRAGDRLALGCAAIVAAYAVLAVLATADSVAIAAPLVVLALLALGVVLLWPAGLAIVTAAAPRRAAGMMVGLFYLHGFFANIFVGWIGIFYERMTAPMFWTLHAGVAGVALALAVAARGLFDRGEDRRPA